MVNNHPDNNKSVLYSFIWKFLERGGTQVVQFIIQIMLARILLPDEYGVVSIVTIFITLANVFIQNGFNTALIQKKEVDNTDYSSVLYLSLFVALILYILIFISAPTIAYFYRSELLAPVLRVLSLTLFLGAVNSIQTAIVSRTMQFKKYFFSSLFAMLISGIVGIILAYLGYGVWSLVVQQLLNMVLLILTLFFTIKWYPKLLFSFKKLKVLFSYGWKLLCSSLIDTLYNNIYDLVIGKKYTTSDLAFYNRGKQFPNLIVANVNGSISTVLLPVMSKEQDNPAIIKEMTRKAITVSSFIMLPMMIGLAAIAKPLVSLILTDKWLECVPFLQMLSFSYALWPIHTANLQAINAIGRSDIFLKLEIIKKIIGILILVVTIPMGLYAMAFGQIFNSLVSTFINSYPNKKLLNYSYLEQIKDILPMLIISVVMGVIISLFSVLNLGNFLTITLQVIFGVLIYLALSLMLKIPVLINFVNSVKSGFIKTKFSINRKM